MRERRRRGAKGRGDMEDPFCGPKVACEDHHAAARGGVKAELFPFGPGKSASAASSLDASRAEAIFPSQATVGSVRKELPPCPTACFQTQPLRPCIYGSEARWRPPPRSWL